MKLRALIVAVVFAVLFLVAGTLYAANGDLIVNGNLGVGTGTATPAGKAEINGNLVVDGNIGVGTTTPQAKLDVNGTISVMIDGKRFTLQYANFSEDVYAPYSLSTWTSDTCDGNIYGQYACLPNENRTCTDCAMYLGCRNITCKAVLYFVTQ